MIICPNCGKKSKDDILIYNEALRKQRFRLSPILPTCKSCGAEATVSHKCKGGNIIILNGTCGSGKSTIAELLQDRGWLAVDGDCAIQVIKHKYDEGFKPINNTNMTAEETIEYILNKISYSV